MAGGRIIFGLPAARADAAPEIVDFDCRRDDGDIQQRSTAKVKQEDDDDESRTSDIGDSNDAVPFIIPT